MPEKKDEPKTQVEGGESPHENDPLLHEISSRISAKLGNKDVKRAMGGGDSGGSGKPSRDPDKPEKEFSWTTDFEIDPENPQVEISMDIEKWVSFNSTPNKSNSQESGRLDIATIKVEDEIIKIRVGFMYRRNEKLEVRLECDRLLSSTFSPFLNARHFSIELNKLIDRELFDMGIDVRWGCSVDQPSVAIENIYSLSQEELRLKIENLKKGIEIMIEIMLKTLSEDKPIEVRIPNPLIREVQGGVSSMPGGEEMVKGLEVADIDLTLDDMGGNFELKKQIKRLVTQYENPKFFKERGVSLPKGILLYGPPGTGKTLAAKIFAGEIDRTFYYIKASDILSKYYGESARRVKEIFDSVEGPCIIFIDEIDSIGGKRDEIHEASQKVLSELLQQLDGMKSRDDIILLAATNRKESLDSALIRPGRFDRHILVDRPDEEARKEIWKIHIKKQTENSTVKIFEDNLDIDLLAKENGGLVGADIEEIIRVSKEKIVFASFEKEEDVLISTQMLKGEIKNYQEERKRKMQRENEEKKIGFGQ